MYYDLCDRSEAEVIVLPYYLGNAFEAVVKIVDNKFVMKGKLPLTRTAVDDVYDPKDNDILGYIAIEWVESTSPRYEGEVDTLIEVYNKKVKYLKKC